MRVGLDCDEVLYPFGERFSRYMISKGYRHCTVDSMEASWQFYRTWGMDDSDFVRHLGEAVDAGEMYRHGDPYLGAVEATQRLAEVGHTIHILSARRFGSPGTAMRTTALWLAENKFVFDSLTITKDKTEVPTDCFLEDNVENFIALTLNQVDCYLVDRPWNQNSNKAWKTLWPDECGDIDWWIDSKRVESVGEFADIITKEEVYAY